jgi:two-component system sensor histidine kinase KdpD
LLAAGIDVYTTLNVQHIEGLNDIVAQITGVRIRETVPDRIVDEADQVELVDISPEMLIQRLHEGKVYMPEQAGRALGHYFQPGNLTALRELALRRTAERVEEQMVQHMRLHAISGPWVANERVLVCVSEQPNALALVRYARRVAERLRAKWIAIYVESPRHALLGEAERDRIAEALRFAESLGGEAVSIPGHIIADDIVAYARSNNVSHIITGKSKRSRWFELRHGSVVDRLVRGAPGISVHVVADEALEESGVKKEKPPSLSRGQVPEFPLLHYGISSLIVLLATAMAELISRYVQAPNISLVYLTAVLVSAVYYGLWPSLFTSMLSALAYNFFFLPPLYTFTIADPANVLSLIFFFAVSILTSNLMAQTQRQTIVTREQARTASELYGFARKIAAIGLRDELLRAATHQIATMLDLQVVILTPAEPGSAPVAVRAACPSDIAPGEGDLAAAHWAWTQGREAGRGSDTLPGGKWLFLPAKTERGLVALVGLSSAAQNSVAHVVLPPLVTPQQRRLLNALIDQTAIAIERFDLAADINQARVQAETERLRAALLSSLSHDLRTPLASILGSITALRSYDHLYDAVARDELLATAEDEAERLTRFVANLLDMTRLESGVIKPKPEAVDVEDMIGTVLRRATKVLEHHKVKVALAPDVPEISVDHTLMEHVLFNLLDNAAKYAPPDTEIVLEAKRDRAMVLIAVSDSGPGIDPDDLDLIFDKFYRANAGDRHGAGTGLGLSICRGFLEVMGGSISATNRPGHSGAVFTVSVQIAS